MPLAPGSILSSFDEIGFGETQNIVTGIQVRNGGYLLVIDGGVSNGSTISSGGVIDLRVGGVANNTSVLTSGHEIVSGGVTNGNTQWSRCDRGRLLRWYRQFHNRQ